MQVSRDRHATSSPEINTQFIITLASLSIMVEIENGPGQALWSVLGQASASIGRPGVAGRIHYPF
jgi:hypothetical protein